MINPVRDALIKRQNASIAKTMRRIWTENLVPDEKKDDDKERAQPIYPLSVRVFSYLFYRPPGSAWALVGGFAVGTSLVAVGAYLLPWALAWATL